MNPLPILLSAFTFAAALQSPQTPPLARASVQVVASLRDDVGRQIGTVTMSFDKDFTTSVHTGTSGCELRSGITLPGDALVGWTLEGHIIGTGANEVTVDLQWRRGGTMAPTSGTQHNLAVHPGDRLPLDRVALTATDRCRATSLSLHIGALSRAEQVEALARAFVGGRAGGGAGTGGGSFGGGSSERGNRSGGGGGRSGSSASSSATVTVRPPEESIGFGDATPRTGVGAGRWSSGSPAYQEMLRDSEFARASLQELQVEIWLVHERPGGDGVSYRQLVRTVPENGDFIFDPVVVSVGSPAEQRWVLVRGVLQAQKRSDGGESLYLALLQEVTRSADGTGAMSVGLSRLSMPMPATGEVPSFTIPEGDKREAAVSSGGKAAPGATPGHRFSLRLRVVR